MPVPETTSAEAFERYVGGQCLVACRGEAWHDIKAWVIAPPRQNEIVSFPAVSETLLDWMISGEAEYQEREGNQAWVTHRIRRGSFFLTSGGAPYDCRWKTVGNDPLQSMAVLIALPLLHRALEEVFGVDAPHARLRDLSSFHDSTLNSLMERVHEELLRRNASATFLRGIAQVIAIHLARNYAEVFKEAHSRRPSLPGYKVLQVTHWMAEHMAEDFNLNQLAAQVGVSKFYFTRLFKNALGVSSSHYLLNLRMNEAKRLLRETKRSVVDVALDVGYANPSHFARFFRRETGLSPSDYRQRR